MAHGRFAQLLTLAPEMVSHIDCSLTRTGGLVEADHDEEVVTVFEFTQKYNRVSGQVETVCRKRYGGGFTKARSAGYLANGQLTMRGAGDLSDMDPEE